jgi:hypothetical protein
MFWLWFLLFNSVYCASFNVQAVTTTTATPSGYAAPTTTPSTVYSKEDHPYGEAGAPVWSQNLGQFITGRHEVERDGGYKEDRNKTGPGRRPHRPRHQPCAPCPCMQNPWQMMPMHGMMFPQQPMFPHPGMVPHPGMFPMMHEEDDDDEEEEHHDPKRTRRSTNDDYWHSTGPANPVLSQINMGYNAQMQMRDYLDKYGAPLHMGTINQADFNYPQDFSAFNQPAYYPATNIKDNLIYKLTGPVQATPVGSLVGPLTGVPDAFSFIVLRSGFFRLVSVQKDGIMQISDVNTNVIFSINCNQQAYGGCQYLVPVKNQYDFPKFFAEIDQKYVLTGLLDVTLTAEATGSPTVLSAGTYKIEVVRSPEQFRMKDVISGSLYYVNCKTQLTGSCENLKKSLGL